MYRYCVDDAITYTSEDLVLFRESPFACWMERLSLENPDHGIPPDVGSKPPGNSMERQDELAETLRAEGKRVALIDWDAPEPERRRMTLDAMRRSQDFIVNGQLALGPLSGSANLLMRTSGYSELGNYLYLPCDTQVKTNLHSAFRLCFLADLLHSLQGQLPSQMLIIRSDSDLVPLNTEDHIYHYQAVKQRFMTAMREFRKHRMPDPAESSHFGRWSECANEVLRQRAMRAEESSADVADAQQPPERDEQTPGLVIPTLRREPEYAGPTVVPQNPLQARLATSRGLQVTDTLADQARALQDEPRAESGSVVLESPAPARPLPAADATLENLAFIGSQLPATGGAERSPLRATVEAPVPPDSDDPEPETTVVDLDEVVPEPRQPHPAEQATMAVEVDWIDDSDYRLPGVPPDFEEPERPPPVFSNSLNTAGSDLD